jgi:asparaginyl-tRNA synthetase
MSAIRSFLEKQAFVEIAPVIISPATDPGIRGADTLAVDFYGAKYLLTTSMILQKQMLISVLDRIFVFSPCVRLERHSTNRHLAEFLQIDVESANSCCEDIMMLAENLIASATREIRDNSTTELRILDRAFNVPKTPFKRFTFTEAVRKARELGAQTGEDGELSFKAETLLSMHHEEPFWITGYPVDSRGFYYKGDPSEPHRLRDFDLIFPEGFGEGISGGEREYRHDVVLKKIKKRNLNPRDYDWYLKMLRSGIPPSAGFGIGLERITSYICGLEDISEATPFPRIPRGIYSAD